MNIGKQTVQTGKRPRQGGRRAAFAALAWMLALCTTTAQAQALPPLIRLVVPFTPGASTDTTARALAKQLAAHLDTNVVVENRPGASGMIGANAVAKAPKDGSSLLFTSVSMITTAATTRNAPFDVTTDLVPVAILGTSPLVIAVSSQSDIKTPADLVAAARAKPDQLTHGTAGVGTIAHLAAELLNDAANIQLKHIPYRGAAPAVTDTVAGILDVMLAANSTFAAQINAGRMRLIAVTTDAPNPFFPDLPTMATVAPGYSAEVWTAVYAPAGTPPDVVARINRAINAVATSPDMAALMRNDGTIPLNLTPEAAAQHVRDSYATWKRVATDKGIALD